MTRPAIRKGDYRQLSSAELRELASAVETAGFERGLAELDGHPNRQKVLADLFDSGTSGWVHLVRDAIGERCLDVDAGFGKRSAMLASVASEVYAVESNRSKLRVLTARLGTDVGTNVTPIGASVDRLPFSAQSFDTVVADAPADAIEERVFRERIATMGRLLADGGTLVITLDGWLRRSGLNALLRGNGIRGDDVSIARIARAMWRANAVQYRRMFRRNGFECVDLYALLPDRRTIRYAFAVDDRSAVSWYLEQELQSSRKTVLATGIDRLGVLEQTYPGYLAVCTAEGGDGSHNRVSNEQLLLARHSRSITFDIHDGELRHVTKTPNSEASMAGTVRENEVLDALRSADEPIVATLPAGTAGSSPFGPTRIEAPVEDVPLDDHIDRDPASFRACLEAGYEWIAAFQLAFRGERIEKSPSQIRTDLQCTHPDVGDAPLLDDSIESFVTPVHGDLSFENVLVRNGAVSCVLDWEFASLSGNPATDAGKFLLSLCGRCFDDFEDGFETIFERETPYAAAFRDTLGTYCTTVCLPPMAIGAYLPLAYVRILNDRRYTPWTSSFVGKTNLVWDRFETVRTRFEECDVA